MKMVNSKFGLRGEYLPGLIIPRFKTIQMTKGFPTCSPGGLWLYKNRNAHCRTPTECSFRLSLNNKTGKYSFLPRRYPY